MINKIEITDKFVVEFLAIDFLVLWFEVEQSGFILKLFDIVLFEMSLLLVIKLLVLDFPVNFLLIFP